MAGMGEVAKHRLAIYFSSFSHVKKITIFLCLTLPFLSPCWIAVMASSQPFVSLTSTDKGPNSQEDSLAICKDSDQEDEFNMTHLYLLLAQQEATCLQEYGKLEPAITFEFPQDLFRPFVCLEGSQSFSACEQCIQIIREIRQGYTVAQVVSCQDICRTSFALPKCAERCEELAKKLSNGIKRARLGADAPKGEVNVGLGCKPKECTLKVPASNLTLTTNIFCESATQTTSIAPTTNSVQATSLLERQRNERHFVYLKSIFNGGGDGSLVRRDVPIVFVIEQRELVINASGPGGSGREKWTGWTVLGKSPYGLEKIPVAYGQSTYQWRVTAVGNSGPLAVSIVKPFETLDGYVEPGPPRRIFVIKNKARESTFDVLLGWDPPQVFSQCNEPERACFFKIVLETRNEEESARTVRIKGEPLGVHKVWFYRLKFDSTYDVRITSRSAEWDEVESTHASLSFTTPGCLDAHQFRFDKCSPPPPRNLSYKLEAASPSQVITDGNWTTSLKRYFTAHLKWDPPAHASDTNLVQEYVVDVRAFSWDLHSGNKSSKEYADSRSELIDPRNPLASMHMNLPGNVTHATVDNLDGAVMYTVLVSAVSSKGPSFPATIKMKIHPAVEVSDTALWFWVCPCGALFTVVVAASAFHTAKTISRRRRIRAARDSYFNAIEERDIGAGDWPMVSFTDDPVSSTWEVLEENSFPKDDWHVGFQDLTIGDIIGKGAFGIVRKATMGSDKYLELRKRRKRKTHMDSGDHICGSKLDEEEETGMATVALKMLQVAATNADREDKVKELMTMQRLGLHPHIVTLLGVCTAPKSMYFVLEYCPGGDLLSFLRKFREKHFPLLNLKKSGSMMGAEFETVEYNKIVSHENDFLLRRSRGIAHELQQQVCYTDLHHDEISSASAVVLSGELQGCTQTETESDDAPGEETLECKSICEKDALSFARQIALGMAHLERNHIIHRDLACRNILVMADHKHVKISDFGLSRDIYTGNVYRQQSDGILPLKWMALESISSQTFTSKSDVWSYGIVLWEIATLGAVPYPDVENTELFNFLRTGHRMEQPDNCSEELYALMRKCWRISPADRPNFTELILYLDTMMENEPELYLTFQP